MGTKILAWLRNHNYASLNKNILSVGTNWNVKQRNSVKQAKKNLMILN